VGTSGTISKDSQGREVIGSNYQYSSEGFDMADHARRRERE
jgi:hypothetical protein